MDGWGDRWIDVGGLLIGGSTDGWWMMEDVWLVKEYGWWVMDDG